MFSARGTADRGHDDGLCAIAQDEGHPAKPGERPFDTWLLRQLHAMHDDIAGEPLPAKLLGVLIRSASAPGSAGTLVAGNGDGMTFDPIAAANGN